MTWVRNLINGFSGVLIVLLILWFAPELKSRYELSQQKSQLDAKIYEETYQQRLQAKQDWSRMLRLSFGFIVLASGSVLGFYLLKNTERLLDEKNRQQNGSFALKWVTIDGVRVLIDPNKMTQSFGALTNENVLGKPKLQNEQHQLEYLKTVHRERQLQALPEQGIKYAATGKYLSGGYDRHQKSLPEIVEPIQEVQKLSLQDAIGLSTPNTWIIGQSEQLAKVKPQETIHFGLAGKTGSGKSSSTGLLLAYYAYKFGYHVIVLDGAKGGIGWNEYSDIFEVIDCRGNFEAYLSQLEEIHQQRQTDLQQNKVDHIDRLSNPPKRLFVVVEEFKATFGNNKKLFERFGIFLSVVRSSGIHFLVINQIPQLGDKQSSGNIGTWIVYKLKGKQSYAVDEYHAGKLADNGEFLLDNEKYYAWFTKRDLVVGNTKPITPILSLKTQDIVLKGKPKNQQEIDFIKKVYSESKNKTEACRRIWNIPPEKQVGGYMKYLNEAIK